jgi:hypothetical protein
MAIAETVVAITGLRMSDSLVFGLDLKMIVIVCGVT